MFNKLRNRSGFRPFIKHNSALWIFPLSGEFSVSMMRAQSITVRNVYASTMAASRHPDHRPEATPVCRSSFGLRLSACPADCFHPAAYRSFPAGRTAPLRGADGEADRRKL